MNILCVWFRKILIFSIAISICMGCAPATNSASPQMDAVHEIQTGLQLPELPVEFVEKTGMLNSTSGSLEVAKYQDSEGRIYSVDSESNLVVEMDARILLPAKHGSSPDAVTFSPEELKAKAMTYFKTVIPGFDSLQSSLQYEEDSKGENYFFTWYAEVKPGAMNRPFAQIGLHQNGLLFAYYYTISLEKLLTSINYEPDVNSIQSKNIFRKLPGKLKKMGSTVLLSILLAGCSTQTVTAIVTTPTPTIPTTPTATLDPKVALRESIIQVLGAGNRELPRLTKISYSTPEAGDITITWTINENVSPTSRKVAAQMDATNILKVLEENKARFIYVILIGTFSMQDEHGNTAEIQAMNLGFNKSKLNKVNWQDFQPADVYNLADIADVADEWK